MTLRPSGVKQVPLPRSGWEQKDEAKHVQTNQLDVLRAFMIKILEFQNDVISPGLSDYGLPCTGFTFFLLGYLRLGVLIGFFPRHILVG